MCTTVDQIQDKLQPVIDIDELIDENEKLHQCEADSLNNQEHTYQIGIMSSSQIRPVHKPSWNGELTQKTGTDSIDKSDRFKCGR
jgi:hypothetical protein